MPTTADDPTHMRDPAGPTNWIVQAQQDGSRQSYANAFLQAIGAPLTNNNRALLLAIMQNEGTTARYNPMASTWGAPGATDFNSVHVRNYADVASAIAAQVTQWRKVFPQIVGALMGDNAASVLGSSEWNSYSGNATGSYQSRLAGNFRKFSGDPNAGNGLVGTTGSSSGSPTDSAGMASSAYHQYQFLTGDPDIGSLLQQLGSGAIDDATFLNEVQNTKWWKTHSGSARSWQQLQNSDPASYQQQLNSYSRQIVEIAQQNGVGLDIPAILKLANQWGAEAWAPQDATNAILGYTSAGHVSGGLAYDQEQIRQAAGQYGIKLDDRQAYDYAIGIGKNQQTLNGIAAGFAQQARQLYPHLAQQLDQGFTLQQLAAPYINTAASTLEIDPSSVDLSNPKWSRALAMHDGKSVRQMTNYEWTQSLMSDSMYGFKHTQGAQAAGASLAHTFDGVFGVGV